MNKTVLMVVSILFFGYATYIAFSIAGVSELAKIVEREVKENNRRIDCKLGKVTDC